MLRFPHIGTRYYPELFSGRSGRLSVARASVDTEKCAWNYHDADHQMYPVSAGDHPVFVTEHRHPDQPTTYIEEREWQGLDPVEQSAFHHALQLLKFRAARTPSDPMSAAIEKETADRVYRYCANSMTWRSPRDDEDDARSTRFMSLLGALWPTMEELEDECDKYNLDIRRVRFFHRLCCRHADPVIDIVITNGTAEQQVVHRVGTDVIGCYTAPGGDSSKAWLLTVCATYELNVNLRTGSVDWHALSPPIVLPPGSSARIQVLMLGASTGWPGTTGAFELVFDAGEQSITTGPLGWSVYAGPDLGTVNEQ